MKNTIIFIAVAIVIIIGAYFLKTPKKEPLPTLVQQGNLNSMTSNISFSEVKPINQKVTVTIKTNLGDIDIELDGTKAPVTVGNFVYLAKNSFYNGITFHRVIPDFMIQTGDPLSKDPLKRAMHGTGDPGYKFDDEINDRKIARGSVAMANSGPNTNGSQFFIVTTEVTPWLDGKHTNFGTVVKGMEVVDAISKVERDENDNPVTSVTINEIVVNY